MTFPCIKCKIHKYTITQIHKYTNTKCLKDPTCAIFLKSRGLKDIKYDIPVCHDGVITPQAWVPPTHRKSAQTCPWKSPELAEMEQN